MRLKAGSILLALLLGWPAHAEEMSAADILQEAKRQENLLQDCAAARRLYEELLVPGKIERLTPKERGDALAGAARCAKKDKHIQAAVSHWEKICADDELPETVREYAQRELDDYNRRQGGAGATPAAEVERRVAERLRLLQAQNRRDAAVFAERAARALEAGELDRAQKHVFEAFRLDPDNAEAQRIQRAVLEARPDRGEMLRVIVDFVQTRTIAEYQALDRKLRELEDRGRVELQRGAWTEADRLLRDAVTRIDESDFLELGGVAPGSLAGVRQRLVLLMTQVHERGSKAGKTFRPVPTAPDFESRRADLQAEFFALLARLFQRHEASESPLRFYTFQEPRPRRAKPLVTAQGFLAGTQVTQEPSSLGRARFAVRRVRDTIGTRWSSLAQWSNGGGRRGEGSQAKRLLERFGDILAVEHQEAVHRRIESLAASFGTDAAPMIVDIQVYAAGPGAVVRLTEALGLRAGKRDSGLTLVQRDALIAECAKKLEGLENLTPMGTARVEMHGMTATRLAIQRRTADHPALQDLGPPPLHVPADLASYGLTFDLYAEDLSQATAGLPRSAVSVVATARAPSRTVVVPRRSGPDMPYTRVPRMSAESESVDLELPHFATLVMLGLPNPFRGEGETGAEDPAAEIVALVGIRRDDKLPDPPAASPGARLRPEDFQHQDHELGPLATEVKDHLVLSGWPEHRPADVATLEDRIVDRNRYLARMVGRMAGLDGPEVTVHEGRASGALSPEEHERVAAAITKLRARENDLYKIRVDTAVAPVETLAQWAALPGVRATKQGHLRIGPDAGERVIAAFREAQLKSKPALWTASREPLARATQRVAARQLIERSLLVDVKTEALDGGGTRSVPIFDRVADGWIVEVRPQLENDDKLRAVTVRARIARLLRIDRLPHPGAKFRVDVPAWHETEEGALIDRSDDPILGDRDGYMMVLPFPGDPDKRFVVMVWVSKVA